MTKKMVQEETMETKTTVKEAWIKEQKCIAKKNKFLPEYEHHLGMVENILPALRFQMLKYRLDNLLESDPSGKDHSLDKEINTLTDTLGLS